MLVVLHQDVAYYFLTSLSPPPLDVDAEGRQSDLPKLRRAGADLVLAAVSPFVNAYGGWSPSLQLALEGVKAYYSLSERHGVRLVEKRGIWPTQALSFCWCWRGPTSSTPLTTSGSCIGWGCGASA
jgi:membrane dipeptidase